MFLLLPYSDLAFLPATEERPALGSGRLALGPDGAWAVYDPVRRRIVSDTGGVAHGAVDDLLYATDGTLVVLDETRPGLVPSGSFLAEWDGEVVAVDPFGNGHPMDGSARLLKPPHTLDVAEGVVRRDGVVVFRGEGRVAARALGEWVLVDTLVDGRASRLALHGDTRVSLPVAGRRYVPEDDVALAPDGGLGWLDPREDGVHLVVVAP